MAEEKKRKSSFPLTVLRNILKSNGAILVSSDALKEFDLVLKDLADDVAKRSVDLCAFRKSTMVAAKDVRQATR
jgi:histone H3/H4